MAKGVNKVILVGNLGNDPEVRHTNSGNAVCNLRLACTERVKDGEGNWGDRTEWVDVVVWGRDAENAGQWLRKGRQVYVEGRLQTRSFTDRDGMTGVVPKSSLGKLCFSDAMAVRRAAAVTAVAVVTSQAAVTVAVNQVVAVMVAVAAVAAVTVAVRRVAVTAAVAVSQAVTVRRAAAVAAVTAVAAVGGGGGYGGGGGRSGGGYGGGNDGSSGGSGSPAPASGGGYDDDPIPF